MSKVKQGSKFAFISAVCFIVYALYNIIPYVNDFYYGPPIVTVGYILLWLGLIGLVVTLFLRNDKFVSIATCVTILGLFLRRFIHYISLQSVLMILAYIALLFILILSIKGNEMVKRLWFLPSAFLIVRFIIILIPNISLLFSSIIYILLSFIIEAIALFFAGLWLKTDFSPAQIQSMNANSTHSLSSSVLGGAEKLKAYKELLDSGAITQEEFDAKKKEIIG